MLRKSLSVLTVLSLTTGIAHAQAWTGGDDLPTSPLACDGTPGTSEAVAYDGGVPTNAPDRNGKTLTVVDVPKLIGIGYFDATSKGIQEAAAELGNMTVTTDAPVEANIDDQITVIDNYVTKGVDGILFAAIGSAMIFVNVSAYWLRAVIGVLILVTVLVDMQRRLRETRGAKR